jgi:hypothetical protein
MKILPRIAGVSYRRASSSLILSLQAGRRFCCMDQGSIIVFPDSLLTLICVDIDLAYNLVDTSCCAKRFSARSFEAVGYYTNHATNL